MCCKICDHLNKKKRLDEFRCRMLKRGIEAAPIFNSLCGDYERYMDMSVLEEPAFNYYLPASNNSVDRHFYNFNLIIIFVVFFKMIHI